jgi:outer membrane protein assembly factor BamD
MLLRRRSILTVLLPAMILALAGCASSPEDLDETRDWTAEKFYAEATSALDGGDYETAIKNFEKLEARFPFGRYAQQAQLDTAYAYYKFGETESAISGADRFIKLHPTHPNVDYAYYLKGLASFQEGVSAFEKLVGKNPAHMDPGMAQRSYTYFGDLVKKYPASTYAADARQRMIHLHNSLAQHEADIAAFYLRRGVYVAALSRARTVVQQYQRTPAMADALTTMARAYHALRIDDLARDSLRVLELNYPEDRRVGEIKGLLAGNVAAAATTATP